MSLFAKKTEEKSTLVCIIESGGVRLGLSLLKPRAKPILLYQVLEAVPLQEKPSALRLRGLTLEALGRAMDKMVREGLAHSTIRGRHNSTVDMLHIVYASPWHISQTKTVTIEDAHSFKLTPKLIREITERETKKMALEYQEKENPALTEISIIEERITNITLNGYPVENPYEKETPRATLTLFASILEKSFREDVENVIHHSLHARALQHHSLPLVLFSGIRDTFAAGRDFLIAITGAEITDVAYARKDTLVDTGSFPVGRATMVRALAQTQKQTAREATSFFSQKFLEHLDTGARETASQSLRQSATLWSTAFRKTLQEIFAGAGSPQTLFLVGGEEQRIIRSVIESEHLNGTARLVELTGSSLKPFCDVGGGVSAPDSRVVFATLYAHKLDF